MKTVRIGAAQGFYGDTIEPAVATAEKGNVQYICFDALAELTMAILVKDKRKNENAGYTKDISTQMKALLPYVKEKGIKLLTNAGGINPIGAQQEVLKVARELGFTGLKVAVVTGDNVIDRIDEFQENGVSLDHLETGAAIDTVKERLEFANAYIGAQPIVEALRAGADIVITGRTTDTAQFLAPLIYEFDWSEEEWDKLASGVFMGHLLECSAQSTGGNFSGKWWDIEGFDQIGYPIAEVSETGEFIVSKVEERGGLVTVDTVKEQMLYEIHDPSAYFTPDVVVDLTNVKLENIAPNQVKVTGTKGKPKPETLKVVMGYENGYLGQVMVGFSWPDAMLKAKKVDEIIRKQLEKMELNYDEVRTDFIGHNSLHGPLAHENDSDLNEIYLRMAVRAKTKQEAAKFSRLFPPLALNGPPTMSGFTGNSAPRALIGMWSTLIDRNQIEKAIKVEVEEV
ncbi:acyclic terpene utilization AtuA family protein [Alkalihalobacterium alkalinitrilicum]|uniref:acyclic terpene utilization AtuA family protein n=1 Tax=Alkalihalobacterium alkalinitrilicum TaxID=427920 RepID=UPI0009954BC8|nr:acyclic terpene utilization AtuA family protein [Alkalihalobacterium alkalinitrilicum]